MEFSDVVQRYGTQAWCKQHFFLLALKVKLFIRAETSEREILNKEENENKINEADIKWNHVRGARCTF